MNNVMPWFELLSPVMLRVSVASFTHAVRVVRIAVVLHVVTRRCAIRIRPTMDSRRCFLRLKRERGSEPDPRTIAVPVGGDAQRIMVFDLIKRSNTEASKTATFDSLRDASVEDQFDGLSLSVGPSRPQPRPERMAAECNSIHATRDGKTIFIEARFAKDKPPATKRSRDTMNEEHQATWALYEARGNSMALRGELPPPTLDSEADSRLRSAQLRHETLLDDFVQRVDPDKLSQSAWNVLDVPLDQPWTFSGTETDLQRLVFDDDGSYSGIPDVDDDGTFASYRRMRRYIAAQSLDPASDKAVVVPPATAVEVAAYGGDDYDSNAEDNSENLYPSTDEEKGCSRRIGKKGSDGTDTTDDSEGEGKDRADGAEDWDGDDDHLRPRRRRGESEDGDDGEPAVVRRTDSDSWGVRSPTLDARRDREWGDSDDDGREACNRREIAFANRNPGSDDDDDGSAKPRAYARENFENFAPDEVFYDAEGNAYW
jgi:hypothetical protein